MAVRQRSAKPLFVGSIPTRASNLFPISHKSKNFFREFPPFARECAGNL